MLEVDRVGRRRTALVLRSEALNATRQFFRGRSFIEISAPVWVRTPGLDVHIKAIEAGGGYLATSPEFALKRLLCGGMERIYSLGPCFRADECGIHHSVEFTMLEWYRASSQLSAIETDTEELISELVTTLTSGEIRVGSTIIDCRRPWPRLTIRELFASRAGIDIRGNESDDELCQLATAAGHRLGSATRFDDIFYTIWLESIEPTIPTNRPVFVCDWPVRLAALAKTKVDDPACVERFELYMGGVELANAFGELTDPVEQRRRFEAERSERAQRGLAVYPIDEKFLAALEQGMPPAAGIALGFDRLVMLLAGASSIGDVQAFANGEI